MPSYWTVRLTRTAERSARLELNAILTLSTVSGPEVDLAVEVKPTLRESEVVIWQLDKLQAASGLDVVLITEFANPTVRAKCAERGFGYVDSTGWVRIESRRPPVFVLQPGALRAPRSDRESDISSLSGVGASRIVRALLVSDVPLGVRELAGSAGVSPGSVAKLLPTLSTAGCVERDDRGAVVLIRRRQLVERWAQDYSFVRSNAVSWWLAPRGVDNTLARAGGLPDVAATGSLVSRAWLPESTVPVTPLTLAALYVADVNRVVDALRLKPAPPSKANMVLAVPRDDRLLSEATRTGALTEVPLGQALADLLTLPGRSIEEAEQVMDVLARSDPSWLQEGVLL